MAVPQVIDTNLNEQQADELKAELDDFLQQEAPHNPFIDIDRGSCYNQKAADLIAKTVAKADLSWEDFLPALNLAYNTSYQSSVTATPFQLLYGYTPKLPTSYLEAATSASTSAQERFLTFKRVLQTIEQEIAEEKDDTTTEIAKSFQLNLKNHLDNIFGLVPAPSSELRKTKLKCNSARKRLNMLRKDSAPSTNFK